MKKRRVHAARTHFDVTKRVRVGDSDTRLKNGQGKQDMLIDPEDLDSGFTHSSKRIKANMSNSLIDEQLDFDSASTYADAEDDDLPLEEVPDVGEVYGEDDEDDETVVAESDEDDVDYEVGASGDDEEFADLGDTEVDPVIASDEDEFPSDSDFGDDEVDAEVDDVVDDEVDADYETDDIVEPAGDSVSIVDADSMSDECDGEDVTFTTVGNSVHAIVKNRIVASIGAAAANRADVGDIYTTPQFKDVVLASIGQKGLRKGLVQSGFVLAKIALKADRSVDRVVKAKIEAGIKAKVSSMKRTEKALDQAMAIAAVGINKKFFKGAENPLKAHLEAELVNMGVRGAQTIVRAAFARYGVDYAKAIHMLARKIAAMPEEMRDTYADALDMTEEEYTEEVDSDVEGDEVDDGDEETFDQVPSTVSAALLRPVRRGRQVTAATSKNAMAILSGNASLIF